MNMKNPIEMLKEIKNLLGVELSEDTKELEVVAQEVKLAQMKLENGTVIEAEMFEKDYEVFIVTEDNKVAMPVGEYEMEDGKILVVEEEGIIKEVKEEEVKEEVKEEVEEEVEMAEVYATKAELAEIKSMIEEIKAMIKPKEEMSEEAVLKAELSKPAAEPFKHNPEAKPEMVQGFLFSQNREFTTIDRIMNNIANLK
jgi:hypothetical protein